MRNRNGFSLVEVTLAIGVIAFALIALLGLLPVGMKSGAEAIDATHVSLIGVDSGNRVKNAVTSVIFASASDTTLPTWFYNRDGAYVGTTVTTDSYYRADATIHKDWGANPSPPNVDATTLRPATVQVRWPINTSNGNALGSSGGSFTFYVRRP